MKKIKKEDLNQDKGGSKGGDKCHPDTKFINTDAIYGPKYYGYCPCCEQPESECMC